MFGDKRWDKNVQIDSSSCRFRGRERYRRATQVFESQRNQIPQNNGPQWEEECLEYPKGQYSYHFRPHFIILIFFFFFLTLNLMENDELIHR